MNLPKTFLYGTAAYRPTNPPAREFRKHLACIKHDLGFDLLRLRVQWNPVNRDPDRFDFDELDQLLDLCEAFELMAFLEISLQTAPFWLEEAHPQSRYVNAMGQPAALGPNASSQIGGYPGLCHHHPAVIEAGAGFLTAVGEHFRHRQSVLSYDCWNEPHLEPAWMETWGSLGERLFCYCEGSRRAFRRWLVQRYGTIEVLNDTWGRAFPHWDQVHPPNRFGNYADWLDWGRFWHDDLREHMRWRYGTLRAADPDRFIMSHSGAVPPFLARANAFIHNWKLAEPVDLWGTSLAPLAFNWDLADIAGVLDATRSAARGKPWWINELSGGACVMGTAPGAAGAWRRTPLPTPSDYETWNWLAVCHGATATVHWCYLEERHGPESGAFGLVRANGEMTDRARGAASMARVLRRHGPQFFDYRPEPQVGVLFDPDISVLMMAIETSDQLYGDAHYGIARAVWRSDNMTRYVTFESLEDLQGLRVLIMPMCMALPDHVGAAIAEFVQRGGVLVAEARTGHYDHRAFNQPVLPAAGLTEVVGAVEGEALCSDPDNRPYDNNPDQLPWPDPIYAGPEIVFREPMGARLRAREYFVPLRATTATPIAESMGHCLAVRNAYGQGTAYYVGTYLSLAIHRGDPQAMAWLVAVLRRHTSPPVSGRELRPRLIDGGREALLAVFNDSRTETRREEIELPRPCSSARDVHAECDHPVGDQRVTVEVAPHGVRVLELTGAEA